MVSIQQRPTQGTAFLRITPVNNVMPFVVTSNYSDRNEFNFVFDAYIDGSTTAPTLPTPYTGTRISRSFGDSQPAQVNLAASYEPHRLYSSYLDVLQSHQVLLPAISTDALRRFLIAFGETMSNELTILTMDEWPTGTGDVRVIFSTDHKLQVGDYVTIDLYDSSTVPTYQGTFQVTQVTLLDRVRLDLAYTSTVTGTDIGEATENWGFTDTVFGTGGFVQLGSNIATTCDPNSPYTNKHYMQVGDEIMVTVGPIPSDPVGLNPQYTGRWRVTQVIDEYNILTNIPWDTSTVCQPGWVTDLRNRIYPNEAYSTNYAYVVNSTFQEADYLYTDPSAAMADYHPDLTNNDSLLLTNKVDRTFYYDTNLEDSGTIGTIFGDEIDGTGTFAMGAVWNRIYFQTFDSLGNSIAMASMLNPYASAMNGPFRIDIPVWPWNLNNAPGTTWADGIARPTFINSNVAYYQFALGMEVLGTPNIVSQVYTMRPERCQIYEKFRLGWINDLGGWDYFNFRLASKETHQFERSTFRKKRGTLSSTSNVYNATNDARGLSTFNTQANKTWSVVSDWITQDQAIWLQELYRSPKVYLWRDSPGTAGFRPITILDESYTIGDKKTTKNILVSISFTEAWDINTIR